jgi:predicted TIM-barrel fold metal-dependent hydrolase
MQRSTGKHIVAVLTVSGLAAIFALFVLPRVSALKPVQTAKPLYPRQGRPSDPQPVAAFSPYIDVHAHLDPGDAAGSVAVAVRAMRVENAARLLFLPSPFTFHDPGRYAAEIIRKAESKYPNRLAFLGGGGTLNAMIQQAVQSGDDGLEVQRRFRERAEQILREGAVGFGEMTAEHFPTASAYQYAPPDHPLFLLLADIAAQHGVPIDLHMEAVPQAMPTPAGIKSPPAPRRLPANIPAFERLLAHNPRAKIVWAHLGWDNTGYRTVALSRRLLAAHPNLYMELKIDPIDPGKNSPLTGGGSGKIKPEWLKLFEDFPDRFVIGTDQHYPMPKNGPQRWQAAVLLFNQLPAGLRQKIGIANPVRIYNLTYPKPRVASKPSPRRKGNSRPLG